MDKAIIEPRAWPGGSCPIASEIATRAAASKGTLHRALTATRTKKGLSMTGD
jgi:hypothetical protein